MLVLLFGWSPYAAYRRTNPGLRDMEQEFRFTEGGAEVRTGIAEMKLDWKAWVRFKETRHFFMLFPNTTTMHILPKRAFASEEERIGFRDLLKEKLGS